MPNLEQENGNERSDQLFSLLKLEESYFEKAPSVAGESKTAPGSRSQFHVAWRRKICEWSYEVVDQFGYDREVVLVAINFIDRMIGQNEIIPQGIDADTAGKLQLLALTCLYMSMKIHGDSDRSNCELMSVSVEHFVVLGRQCFTAEDIRSKEKRVLFALGWKVNPPTPITFLTLFLKNSWEKIKLMDEIDVSSVTLEKVFHLARYLGELSVCLPEVSTQYRASTIAQATVACALELICTQTSLKEAVMNEFFSPSCDVDEINNLEEKLHPLCPDLWGNNRDRYLDQLLGQMERSYPENSSPVCVVEANKCQGSRVTIQ